MSATPVIPRTIFIETTPQARASAMQMLAARIGYADMLRGNKDFFRQHLFGLTPIKRKRGGMARPVTEPTKIDGLDADVGWLHFRPFEPDGSIVREGWPIEAIIFGLPSNTYEWVSDEVDADGWRECRKIVPTWVVSTDGMTFSDEGEEIMTNEGPKKINPGDVIGFGVAGEVWPIEAWDVDNYIQADAPVSLTLQEGWTVNYSAGQIVIDLGV